MTTPTELATEIAELQKFLSEMRRLEKHAQSDSEKAALDVFNQRITAEIAALKAQQ